MDVSYVNRGILQRENRFAKQGSSLVEPPRQELTLGKRDPRFKDISLGPSGLEAANRLDVQLTRAQDVALVVRDRR